MDPIVEAALRKWPNVPHCHGWLALDQRGTWWMRDERTQARGPFPAVKGSAVRHDKLLGFIGRNYAADERGCWFFQNGPQRVYVQLEAAPWVWRVGPAGEIESHTGLAIAPGQWLGAWLDEHGRLYLHTTAGLGIVHPQDMVHAAERVADGRWVPQEVHFRELPSRFGYVLTPGPEGPGGDGPAGP
jgi:hypothetical protein